MQWMVVVDGQDQDGDFTSARFQIEADTKAEVRTEAAAAARDCGWTNIEVLGRSIRPA